MSGPALSSSLDVLIIDDDSLIRDRLETLLETIGRGSLGVGSLEQAREAIKVVYFPLIILDRKLDDGEGLDLCREYRDRYPDASTAILVLSNADSSQGIEDGIAAGADAYLSKSCQDAELLHCIQALHSISQTPSSPEQRRVKALKSYGVMDSMPEQAFDDITRLASSICHAPIALISFVDENRQWFKAQVGLGTRETSREHAFCAHAIQTPQEVMVIPDATQDPRFLSNPFVTGTPNIRFYAGAPLVTSDGSAIGTVCVIDDKPRQFDEDSRAALMALSRQVVILLEQRKLKIEQAWLKDVHDMVHLVRSVSQQDCQRPHPAPCTVCEARALLARTEVASYGAWTLLPQDSDVKREVGECNVKQIGPVEATKASATIRQRSTHQVPQ